MLLRKLGFGGRSTGQSHCFKVLVDSRLGDEGRLQWFWCRSKHLGEAIDGAIEMSRSRSVTDVWPIEADYLDPAEMPANVTLAAANNVICDHEIFAYEAEPIFRIPKGIIKAAADGSHDTDEIRPGFERGVDDDRVYWVQCIVDANQIDETFGLLLSAFPEYRVMWLELSNEWDGARKTVCYTNESLTTAPAILNFLNEHRADTIDNGFVSVTAYAEPGQTNINIDRHKTLKVLTLDESVQNLICAILGGAGYPELETYLCQEFDFFHHHYRPATSLTREFFSKLLKSYGFQHWKR